MYALKITKSLSGEMRFLAKLTFENFTKKCERKRPFGVERTFFAKSDRFVFKLKSQSLRSICNFSDGSINYINRIINAL